MKLKNYLKLYGESKASFASRLGVTEGAVNHWVSGIRRPNDNIKKRIAEATDGAVMPNDWFDFPHM